MSVCANSRAGKISSKVYNCFIILSLFKYISAILLKWKIISIQYVYITKYIGRMCEYAKTDCLYEKNQPFRAAFLG